MTPPIQGPARFFPGILLSTLICFGSSPALSFFEDAGQGTSDPAAAGRGGVQVPWMEEIPSALLGNPAALATLKQPGLGLLAGAGSAGGPRGSLLVLGSPSSFGGWAVGLSALDEPSQAGLRGLDARVAAALSFSRPFQAGLRLRYWKADLPGAGTGVSSFSPDLGFLLRPGLPSGWGRLSLGAGLSGMMARLKWKGGSTEPGARVLRVGLAYSPRKLFQLGLETSRVEFPGTIYSYDESRAGLEIRPWTALAFRAGWQKLGDGSEKATAGLGLKAGSFRLDYALALKTEGPASGAFHQGGLEWGFGSAPGAVQVRSGVLAEGPESPVFFDIQREPGRDVKGWEATLKDDHGQAVKTWRGTGAPPVQLLWDGKDEAGRPSAAQGSLAFEIKMDGEERQVIRSTVDRGRAVAPENLRLLDLGGAAPARTGEKAADSTWKAELVDSGGRVVKSWTGKGSAPKDLSLLAKEGVPQREGALSFNVTTAFRDGRTESRQVPKVEITDRGTLAVPRPRAGADKEWQIEIRAKDGTVVKTFQGSGAPPPQIAWDGVPDRGSRAAASGLEFVMRTVESSGEVVESKRSLDPAARGGLAALSLPQGGVEPVLNWSLAVEDGEGRRLKTYAGGGPPPGQLLVPAEYLEEGEGAPRLTAGLRIRPQSAPSAKNRLWTYDRGNWRERLKEGEETPASPAPSLPPGSNRAFQSPEAPPGSRLLGVFYFVYNDSFTMPEDAQTLSDILGKIRSVKNPTLYICGHSDSRGPTDWEDWLSRLRAESVWDGLRRKAGKNAKAVLRSFGSRRRILDEAGREDQPASRRVDVFLAPPGS